MVCFVIIFPHPGGNFLTGVFPEKLSENLVLYSIKTGNNEKYNRDFLHFSLSGRLVAKVPNLLKRL